MALSFHLSFIIFLDRIAQPLQGGGGIAPHISFSLGRRERRSPGQRLGCIFAVCRHGLA